jgi:hypothetical protein
VVWLEPTELEKAMWWKLGVLALLAVGFVALIMATPTSTVDIAVEMPRANASPSTLNADGIALATLITYGFVAAVIALIGWMMWRVVRHHRRLKIQP